MCPCLFVLASSKTFFLLTLTWHLVSIPQEDQSFPIPLVSLEEEKRREYEVWFKNQEKAAMEYSASVQYQQSAQESAASSSTATITSEKKMMESMSSSSSYQQHQQSLLSSSSANSSQAINTSSQQLTATTNMTGNSSSHTSGSSPAVVTPQGSSLTALSVTDGRSACFLHYVVQ